MLLAATNPCPCGYAGDGERCRCTESELARHRRRLSGPLLDRIDLLVNLDSEVASPNQQAATISSQLARERVAHARERQERRLAPEGVSVNAYMDAGMLRAHVRLDTRGEALVDAACRNGLLSARGADRVLRVARTIADLDARGRVSAQDLGAAIAMRPDARLATGRAA